MITGPAPMFLGICITALAKGGPALMASLIVVSSFFQFALSRWLPLMRRVITPVVSGTVVMLIAATIVPNAWNLLDDVPADAPAAAAPCIAGVTLAVAAVMALRAAVVWRLWSPLIGIVAGCAAAVPFGVYDFRGVFDASWAGMVEIEWQGLDVTAGAEFWMLLPVFVVVTLVLAISTVSDAIVIQSASRRQPAATDFRIVQGALNANGVGVLLSGVAGPCRRWGTRLAVRHWSA